MVFAVGHLQLTCCTACTPTVPALTLLGPANVVASAESADAVRQGRRTRTAVHGHELCSPTANGCCSSCWQPAFAEARLANFRLEACQFVRICCIRSAYHLRSTVACATLCQRGSRGGGVLGWIFQLNPRFLRQRKQRIFRVLERATFPSESPCHPITCTR